MEHINEKNNFLGSIFLVIAAMIWGFAFSMQEWAGREMGAFSILFYRSIVATFFIALMIAVFDTVKQTGRRLLSFESGKIHFDIRKNEWKGGIIAGILLSAATTVQQLGINEEGAGAGGFVTSLYMVFIPLVSVFLGKKIHVKEWVCVTVAVIGFFLISYHGEGFSISVGFWLLLLSALLYAFQILAIDRFSVGCDGIRFSFTQFLTATVISLPLMLLMENTTADMLYRALIPLLFLGILSSGVAYTLQILGQQLMTATTVAGVLMSLENVFALLGAVIFAAIEDASRIAELLNPQDMVGCAVILVAVILIQLPVMEPKKA